MKRIETIIPQDKIGPLTFFLRSTAYPGMMITRIEGHGRRHVRHQALPRLDFQDDLSPKLKIEIIAHDCDVPKIVKKIEEICHTWKADEGKIFISRVVNVIRIRTMEQGEAALN